MTERKVSSERLPEGVRTNSGHPLQFHVDRMRAWSRDFWAVQSLTMKMSNGKIRSDQNGLLSDMREDTRVILSALSAIEAPAAAREVTDSMVQKAWEAYDEKSGYSKPERFRAALTAAISRIVAQPALPPVDGLEVVAWDVAPKGLPAEPTKSHSFVAEIEKQGGVISPLVSLPQASSIIAGLKADCEQYKEAGHAYYARALKAEARISSLEEENKRLRKALEKDR